MRLLTVTVALLGLSASSALADCQWARFSFKMGQDMSATASAISGVACKLRVRNGRDTTFTSFKVATQPAHGHVEVANDGYYYWLYTSKAGYKGPDSFVGVVVGTGTQFSGTSHISVSVDVQAPP